MTVTLEDKMEEAQARKEELDKYEDAYGEYVNEHGPFNMLHLKIGVQGFPIFWEDDPEESAETNLQQRRWIKRMLCCALHHLVEEKIHGKSTS